MTLIGSANTCIYVTVNYCVFNRLGANAMGVGVCKCACICLCGCVRGGEVRNNERKKGKGETHVEKMRWRRMMKFGKIIAG